jgi:hypothetical protein
MQFTSTLCVYLYIYYVMSVVLFSSVLIHFDFSSSVYSITHFFLFDLIDFYSLS